MRELREVTLQVATLCLLSVDPENAESKGKARFRDIPGSRSRQLNAGSSNNVISGSPGRIRIAVHGSENYRFRRFRRLSRRKRVSIRKCLCSKHFLTCLSPPAERMWCPEDTMSNIQGAAATRSQGGAVASAI